MNHGLSTDTIDKLKNLFRTRGRIHQVILYGSRAKGTHTTGSDIDLVLKGENLTLRDLLSLRVQLDELNLPYTIDLSLYTQIENADLLDHIHRVGIVIYQTTPVHEKMN